jgi:6-phosphofructokinase 1
MLTVQKVADIHHQGGTILASARGGFDKDVIIGFLIKHGINQLYIIGGDGTHRGANALAEECIRRKLNIAVAGIPKTIDNDVDLIDRSFGFTTSVEAAQAAIQSAKCEARCNVPNGIGIVKLMGRSAGFIAAHATLASGDVDLCLVPEVNLQLDGENGCLPYLMQRVAEQGHAVVVVAEGAGEDVLGKSSETDKGGNRKLPPIGVRKAFFYFSK